MQPIIKNLGLVDYIETWQKMKEFTETRTLDTPDEFWRLEHPPVFTLGLAGKEQHILIKEHNIPIIRADRGGQVTYHGPQQIIIYTLVNLKRINLSIRELVIRIENGIINYLAAININAKGARDAPGVYVNAKKIASLGLKVRKNCTYHGVSFNYNLDLTPFSYINPCGYAGLQLVNQTDLTTIKLSFDDSQQALCQSIIKSIYS